MTDVILLEGVNDIGFSQLTNPETRPHANVSANQIIAAYRMLIVRAHAQGLRIYGGTLTPFRGAGYFTEEGERKRQRVNRFVRTSGAFDGVVDFDRALRDPERPQRLLPRYDVGDHLHPNDARVPGDGQGGGRGLDEGRRRASGVGTPPRRVSALRFPHADRRRQA